MKAFVVGVVVGITGLGAVALAQEGQEETLQAQVVDKTAEAGAGFSNTVCTNGKNKRVVELTSNQGCEVHYRKETEQPGHDQVLWKANNDRTFCEGKAAAFVEKLSSWGWSCSKM